MALLDVNVLIALAWDSHVQHVQARAWFGANAREGWATCPVTESGFVRVSTNHSILPVAIPVADALAVLAGLRSVGSHRFLADDVSLVDPDVPRIVGHRQVTDAHLLTLARRHDVPLVTFDRGAATLGDGVHLLSGL